MDPAAPGQPPQVLDKIKLASPKGSQIAKDMEGLFQVVGGGVLPADENAEVQTAALEQSNVKPSEVIVQMIQAQRLFDIRTKLISTARDVDQSGASLMRMS
jgi:flagellar basal-body rod protein FlgF